MLITFIKLINFIVDREMFKAITSLFLISLKLRELKVSSFQ